MNRLTHARLLKQRIVVLGYGLNNKALVGYLLDHDCKVTVRDANPLKEAELLAEYANAGTALTIEIMPNILDRLEGFDVIFRTPAIPADVKELLKAKKRGSVVTSQTGFFMERCPSKVIGITGTKGKGTTATLTANILDAGYLDGKVYLAGNIGVDPFSFLDDLTVHDLVVLELSSFQLEDVATGPDIAVVLHVTSDHLDHHKDNAAYWAAKARLLEYQEPDSVAIICGDYPEMDYFAKKTKGTLLRYYRHKAGRQAAWVDNQDGKEVIFYQLGETLDSFELPHRHLLGEHNLENILPAVLVGAWFQISGTIMAPVIAKFGGLAHRLSVVPNEAGIQAYDDSIATTPESCIVALEAMPATVPVHLLAGGKDKGHVYMKLAEAIAARCASVTLLPGSATSKLEKALKEVLKKTPAYGCEILHAEGQTPAECMEMGLKQLAPYLNEGDIVLLSPAESSDLPFLEYKARGDAFAAAVHYLKKKDA